MKLICLIMWCWIVATGHADDKTPAWMDTSAPTVQIEPSDKWHNSLFHVTLRSNESSQLWISQGVKEKMRRYKRPISITSDGVYRYYFYGEDDFGNKSPVDSMEYVLDTRSPPLTFQPKPGVYRKNTVIRLLSNEPCYFSILSKKDAATGTAVPDSFHLVATVKGYFAAVDRAGNRTVSDFIEYTVDTTTSSITVDPPEGIYRVRKQVTISVPSGMEAFYTFDPLAPPEWFGKYAGPFILPHGLTIVRCFGRSAAGIMTEIHKISYIVDTIPPRVQIRPSAGPVSDTLYLNCKEDAVIRYTADGSVPSDTSKQYSLPLVMRREGVSRIKAKAWDRAGNSSAVVVWEYKYDSIPPVVTAQPIGGTYTTSLTILLTTNETAKILYSLDSSDTNVSLVYSAGCIAITRQGKTRLRYRAIDAAENVSTIRTEWYMIDSKPPQIQTMIQNDIAGDIYTVSFLCKEAASIYYTVNTGIPTTQSPRYTTPLQLKSGDILKYLGVDSVGNATQIYTVDDLTQPLVEAKPPAGLYNRRVSLNFVRNIEGKVWWRLLPDTLFRDVSSDIVIDKEGSHSFEYFLQTASGMRSALHRNEYFLDWTPPEVSIRIQKGIADSAIIFFEATENASIYYTIDGSNPLYSATTRTAGNRFQRSFDRISLERNPAMKLAFYAEDAAGNQTALRILDIFRPHVIPNIPAGPDRIHDRVLSIELQSQEGAVIHYLRNGKTPTIQSPIFNEPINLSVSDTIVALVVDASGYQGEPETFIYHIDLPPSPQFSVFPETLYTATEVRFDARGTFDRESEFKKLRFRWDFNGDETFDTDTAFLPAVPHRYMTPGIYHVILEVTDEQQRRGVFRKDVYIRDRCPQDMVSAFDADGAAFCIDKYEWPNKQGVAPDINVSWVEAKMSCIDAGKRLCTASEWVSACNNNARSMYPYGDRYDNERCATEGNDVTKSGSKRGCVTGGISDMIGNVWEWVEDKNGDLTQAFGGSYRYGKDAHCGLKFEGTVASRSNETGFRCCK